MGGGLERLEGEIAFLLLENHKKRFITINLRPLSHIRA